MEDIKETPTNFCSLRTKIIFEDRKKVLIHPVAAGFFFLSVILQDATLTHATLA